MWLVRLVGERAWACRVLKALLKTYIFLRHLRKILWSDVVESSVWLLYTECWGGDPLGSLPVSRRERMAHWTGNNGDRSSWIHNTFLEQNLGDYLIIGDIEFIFWFSSVQSLSCVRLFATREPQCARPPCPSPTPRVHLNPCPLSLWCHPTISSSVVPFSSRPQSFPVSGSFQMSQLFASGGQSIGVSASTSLLPMNTQDWSPLGWTSWISLQSKGLLRIFSNTTVQKYFLVRADEWMLVVFMNIYIKKITGRGPTWWDYV